jgi:hypothetical protein
MSDRAKVQVIENKRQPPLWSVKVGNRYVATFFGPEARASAEAYAATNFGRYSVFERPIPARKLRRRAAASQE